MKTLVIGASENPQRYSNLCIKRLKEHGHEVVAVGAKDGEAHGVHIQKAKEEFKNIDTITLYLNPNRQKEVYDYILSLSPRRIIFNPGTENAELEKLCTQKNIEVVVACTLVMLSVGDY